MQYLSDEPLVLSVFPKLHKGGLSLFNFSQEHKILFAADPPQPADQDFKLLQQQRQISTTVCKLKYTAFGVAV